MTPDQATDLAARTLAAIPEYDGHPMWEAVLAADRERVASDLALFGGADRLAKHYEFAAAVRNIAVENLRRTAALYGVSLDE